MRKKEVHSCENIYYKEFKIAIKQNKKGKSTGVNGVSAEILKLLGKSGTKLLHGVIDATQIKKILLRTGNQP